MPLNLGKTGRQGSFNWVALNPIERGMLVVGSVACACLCVWTAQLLGIPREPGFDGSLLASGSAFAGIVVALVAVALCGIVAVLIAKMIEVESGLFCSCAGLIALAIRCGPVRPVLQYASGSSVFLGMATELALLGSVILGVWFGLTHLFTPSEFYAGYDTHRIAPNETIDATMAQKLLTMGVQIVVMAVCELILIQTDAKAQALAGVCISAFLGVLAAYMFTPLPQGIWYWMGPVAVGVIGYALAMMDGGTSINGGDVHGWAAGLARVTPLDYASAGIGGAILGYWCSRRWAQPEDAEAQPDPVQ